MAALGGIVGFCFWPLRSRMRLVRWGIVFALLALQCVMKAPVWFVIDHINITGSSSSYHRAYLVDTFVRHVGDWWLIGTKDNGSWGFDMWDMCNQYVVEGVTGGLATFVLFLVLISRAFGRVGTAIKAVRGNRTQEWFLWLLGVTLLSHAVAFFGISYCDQTKIAWFTVLAMICAATAPYTKSRARGRGAGVVESDDLQAADTPVSA
jgi:hypothetical protein